jgi:acid phosphatase (class A)
MQEPMKIAHVRRIAVVLSCCAGLAAAQAATAQEVKPAKAEAGNDRAAYYFDPAPLELQELIAAPPDKAGTVAEVAELHRIERERKQQEIKAAQSDDADESLFLYATVLGPQFNARELPVTAEFGLRLAAEQSAVASELKAIFARPRPYQADATLHPVCPAKAMGNSYPSGHSLVGYLDGLVLAEMLPERRDAILARADEYARNRLVCGVHYASDTEASRRISYAVFGYLMSLAEFRHDLAAAKTETRAKLGLK